MRREIQAGLLLGCILGVIGFIRVGAWAMIADNYFHRNYGHIGRWLP